MADDISPITLELLFSPGFYLIPEAKPLPADLSVTENKGAPMQPDEVRLPETPYHESRLLFILKVVGLEALATDERQMLERMAGFIRQELGIESAWQVGDARLWQEMPGLHHWVLFGKQELFPELTPFSSFLHERGAMLLLPEVPALTRDALLKKQAVEALKQWAVLR